MYRSGDTKDSSEVPRDGDFDARHRKQAECDGSKNYAGTLNAAVIIMSNKEIRPIGIFIGENINRTQRHNRQKHRKNKY